MFVGRFSLLASAFVMLLALGTQDVLARNMKARTPAGTWKVKGDPLVNGKKPETRLEMFRQGAVWTFGKDGSMSLGKWTQWLYDEKRSLMAFRIPPGSHSRTRGVTQPVKITWHGNNEMTLEWVWHKNTFKITLERTR